MNKIPAPVAIVVALVVIVIAVVVVMKSSGGGDVPVPTGPPGAAMQNMQKQSSGPGK
jgi:hypothetical protein